MAITQYYKTLDGNQNELINWSGEKVAADFTGGDLYTGRMWYNTTDVAFKYYDGAAVKTIATLEDLTKIGAFQGVQDATAGVPSVTLDGSPIVAGDYWRVSVAGTIVGIGGSDVLEIGDLIYATADGATTAADFTAVQANLNLAGNIGLVEEVALASLPANTATAVPTTFTDVYSIEVYNSANEKIHVCEAGPTTAPTLESNTTLAALTIRVVGL